MTPREMDPNLFSKQGQQWRKVAEKIVREVVAIKILAFRVQSGGQNGYRSMRGGTSHRRHDESCR
jgi:hypothetical protein